MRQIAWKLTFVGGLLLATGVACTDRSTPRVPQSTPVAEATPVLIEEPLTYTVVAGDFLSEIANRFDVTLDELTELNGIANAALIEVGQVLKIPGTQTVVADHFAVVAPAERFPEIYPPQQSPPPPELSPLDELRNRIAAWPWPPRETLIERGVIGGFALVALFGGLMLTSAEYSTRRWAVRAAPRGARRLMRWWGDAAVKPRHLYLKLRAHAIAGWQLSVRGRRAVGRGVTAANQRYQRARAAVIVGWTRTKGHRERIAERAKPVLERADDIAGRAVDVTLERSRELIDTVRDRAPTAADSFNHIGERATSMRRSVQTGAQRARRDVFEQPVPQERWRSRIAGELASAFERNQLKVRYVPVLDLDIRTVTAVEAHLFWQHPQRGLMAARDIHSATQEHPELGAALLEFLLEQSCTFLKERVDHRFPSAQLIVPITLEQIVESEPLAAIDRGLSSANLALDRLKMAIAEPYALQDPHTAAAFIRNLRSMGIGVHLDDYGMAAGDDLRQLGVSSVTVDFAAAGTSPEARSILSEAVEAAQELRLPVTTRHARSEPAQSLQVSLGCLYEAVGEPILADAFVSTYVDEQTAAEAPSDAAEAATSPPAADDSAPNDGARDDSARNDSAVDGDTDEADADEGANTAHTTNQPETTVEKQTRRPAGPLRMSRPLTPHATDEPLTAGTTASNPGDPTILLVDQDIEETESSDGSDEEASPAASTDANRPVDAA